MGTVIFVLHELILCVSEDCFSVFLCSHIVCMQMFVLHALSLCVPEDLLFV